MKVGIPKESFPGERRVAGTPNTVGKLVEMGFEVLVEQGAGTLANYPDAAYAQAGATLVDSAALWADADILTKVRAPNDAEIELHHEGQLLISLLFPGLNPDLVDKLAARDGSVVALDKIPRISRAQKMDVLSSMANIAGYRAVLEAANVFGSFFGGQITAAGRTRPARVLVIGAGVAGLAAIAAARSLGAEVRSFDVRPAVKEQIESLGATFLMLDFPAEDGETAGGYAKTMSKEFIDAEMALFAEQAREIDVIITTALIPGKRAPILITKAMVDSMNPGGVVVDLAAEQGGNCEYTQKDEVVDVGGVKVIGYTDLTSRLATHASQFFGTNVVNLLDDMGGGTAFTHDLNDEVLRKSTVVHQGTITWPPPPDPPKSAPDPSKAAAGAKIERRQSQPAPVVPAPKKPKKKKEVAHSSHSAGISSGTELAGLGVMGVVLLALGTVAPPEFIQHVTVFILACFIGWRVVWNVTPALHTPLMSVTNAISGIIVVGGILQTASGQLDLPAGLGAVAILVAAINIAGGFLVTQRMLAMFRKDA